MTARHDLQARAIRRAGLVAPAFTAGWQPSEARRLKQLDDENAKLRRPVAEPTLENDGSRMLFEKMYGEARCPARGCPLPAAALRGAQAAGLPHSILSPINESMARAFAHSRSSTYTRFCLFIEIGPFAESR